MAFPSIITTNAAVTNDSQNNVGPFRIGSALYKVAVDGVGATLNMYRSVDDGATWALLDAAHAPANGGNPSSADTDGSQIFVASTDTTSAFLIVAVFDTGTDLWSSSTTSAFTIGSGSAGSSTQMATFYRTADAQVVIAFQDQASPTRTHYTLFDPVMLTFSSSTPIGETGAAPENWLVADIIRGSGMCHFLLYRNNGSPSFDQTFYQQALSDGGILGSLTSIGNVNMYPGFKGFGDGTNVVLASVPDTFVNSITIFTGASADPITFATETLSVPSDWQAFLGLVAILNSGRFIIVQYEDLSSNEVTGIFSDFGTGFGAFQVLINDVGNSGPFPAGNWILGVPNVFWAFAYTDVNFNLVYWQGGQAVATIGSYSFGQV